MSSSLESSPLQALPVLAPLLPPHPLDQEWYIAAEGQTYGPYAGRRIGEMAAEGRVAADTSVYRVGGTAWMPAIDDPALRSLFPALPPPAFPAPSQHVGRTGVSAAEGSTVVQVTNHITAPEQRLTPTILIEDGPAAPKSAGVAVLLSLVICGAGQMYNGQVGKGFLMLVSCVFLWFIALGWIINIWAIVDAYRTARAMNDRYLRRIALSGIR